MKEIREADGFKWVFRGPDTDDHLALGGHETALGPILESFSDPEKAFINVGAHVGLWALRMAEHFKLVYAVEANLATYHVLYENTELNDLLDQVFPVFATAWDVPNETVTLIDENDKETGGSTRAEASDSGTNITTTLDILFADGTLPVGLITLDVEGAEARVLRGAKKLIQKDRPYLVIELHEGHPGTDPDLRQQVYDLLDELEYTYNSVQITGERLICTPNEVVTDDNELEVVKAGQ